MRLSDALGDFLSEVDEGHGLKQARVAEAWSEVAGAEIAKRTLSAGLRGGELIVQVESNVWATELSLLSEELRGRLNSALGEEVVQTIRFTVSRSVSQAQSAAKAEEMAARRYGDEPVKPEPLSPGEVAEIEREASAIAHEGVRAAVVRAQIRDRELKRARASRECSERRDETGRGGGARGDQKP